MSSYPSEHISNYLNNLSKILKGLVVIRQWGLQIRLTEPIFTIPTIIRSGRSIQIHLQVILRTKVRRSTVKRSRRLSVIVKTIRQTLFGLVILLVAEQGLDVVGVGGAGFGQTDRDSGEGGEVCLIGAWVGG